MFAEFAPVWTAPVWRNPPRAMRAREPDCRGSRPVQVVLPGSAAMSFAVVPGLYIGPLHRTRIGRHLETPSHVRGRQERQHPPRLGRSPGQADRRLERPVHPHRAVRASHGRPGAGAWRFISGNSDSPMVDLGGSPSACWSSPRCPASTKSAGCPWSGRRTSCWWRAAMPSTCATGCDSPGWRTSSVAERDRLGGTERREHGDDPQDRGGLRPVETADR